MSTKEDRNDIYSESFKSLYITQAELTRILNLGAPVTQSARNKISEKLGHKSGRAVPKSEALALQLLVRLQETGTDVSKLVFDATGRLEK